MRRRFRTTGLALVVGVLAVTPGNAQEVELAGTRDSVQAAQESAAEVLAEVVEKAPDVPVFRYHLGMTYYKQGDKRAAKEILAKAVAEEFDYDGIDEARAAYAEVSE